MLASGTTTTTVAIDIGASMPLLRPHLFSTALVLAATCVSAAAGSLVGSSAAGGSSASSAASDSVGTSSDSSTKVVANAEGPYRIVEVSPVPERPGMVRVKLLALADRPDETVLLYLPQQTFERAGLAPGGTITAQQRPYGVEFAHADTRRSFFLLLSDDVQRELRSNPVSL
jgi:hypothetical protein